MPSLWVIVHGSGSFPRNSTVTFGARLLSTPTVPAYSATRNLHRKVERLSYNPSTMRWSGLNLSTHDPFPSPPDRDKLLPGQRQLRLCEHHILLWFDVHWWIPLSLALQVSHHPSIVRPISITPFKERFNVSLDPPMSDCSSKGLQANTRRNQKIVVLHFPKLLDT